MWFAIVKHQVERFFDLFHEHYKKVFDCFCVELFSEHCVKGAVPRVYGAIDTNAIPAWHLIIKWILLLRRSPRPTFTCLLIEVALIFKQDNAISFC